MLNPFIAAFLKASLDHLFYNQRTHWQQTQNVLRTRMPGKPRAAGTKIARLAANQAIGMRGRVALSYEP